MENVNSIIYICILISHIILNSGQKLESEPGQRCGRSQRTQPEPQGQLRQGQGPDQPTQGQQQGSSRQGKTVIQSNLP